MIEIVISNNDNNNIMMRNKSYLGSKVKFGEMKSH